MKTLVKTLAIGWCSVSFAQPPEIVGDLMLCPESTGTAEVIDNVTYDTYQWYYKYWFTSDPYAAIDGETSEVFQYDWYTYDQALIKVVTTLNGLPYESNVLQIDSYAWLPIFVSYELGENAQYYPESEQISLCEGHSFTVMINNPPYDTNTLWTLNGVLLPNETSSELVVTQPGTYQGSAAPAFCPDQPSTTLPITVTINSQCNLAIPEHRRHVIIYPNPADQSITIIADDVASYDIFDFSGKVIRRGALETTNTITIDDIAAGIYILRLYGNQILSNHKITIH